MSQSHVAIAVPVDTTGRRTDVVYAPSEYVQMLPYTFSLIRWVLYVLLLIGSGGILLIVSVWFPQLFTRIARSPLPLSKIGDAEYLLILVHEDGWTRSVWIEVPVHRSRPSTTPWIWFEFKKHRYAYNHQTGVFERYLATIKTSMEHIQTYSADGFDPSTVTSLTTLYGPNLVDIDAPSIFMLLFTKIVHPFYLFQVFSAVVWFLQDYTLYACVILVLSATSMAWEIYSEVSNSNRLRRMVHSEQMVHLYRAGHPSKCIVVHETELVPGDIIQLRMGAVCADVLLISGGCVVDEASLTGEAVPINKQPLETSGNHVVITHADAQIQMKASFLHAGSVITRIRDGSDCKGIVLSTGFSTGKGELFRSMIFPRTITFEFERDSYRYLTLLAAVALAAFIKRLIGFSHQGYGLGYMIVNSLDLITIAVPPALPLVLSSGVGFALKRLKQQGIFCIDSQRINSCGQVNCFCFDKTGTLTEESLTFVGVDEWKQDDSCAETKLHVDIDEVGINFQYAMSLCHSLSMVDGKVQGYALEIAMFEAVKIKGKIGQGGIDQDSGDGMDSLFNHSCRVIKRFAFDAHYQRSSVIVEWIETKKRILYVKGSPEAIRSIAKTTPVGFHNKTLRYAADGYYCIAFGMRELHENEEITDGREVMKRNVVFMGIALFHNELKPESKGMMEELYRAQVDVRMITGDNALTAIHVARLVEMKLKNKVAVVDVEDQSGEIMYYSVDALGKEIQWKPFTVSMELIMEEYDLAITGAAMEVLRTKLSQDLMQAVVSKITIFARIGPQSKAWIIDQLIDSGRVVGMCGDGTNDCGALKAAHVGLALSSAEASIVAPFTSQAKAITDVSTLICEGRCALTTSFLGFKYMVLYPIIQLGMASTLGHYGYMMSNNQYMWDDLVIVLPLSITMLYTGSSSILSKERPPNTLFSLTIMSSIIGQIILYIAFFVIGFKLLTSQSWYCPRDTGMSLVNAYMKNSTSVSQWNTCFFYQQYATSTYVTKEASDILYGHEGTSIWLFEHLMYFSVAAAFNVPDKFRLPFYTNKLFTGCYVLSLGLCLWFLLDSYNTIANTMQTVDLPQSFRITLFILFLGHVMCALGWEIMATRVLVHWRMQRAASDLTDIELSGMSRHGPVMETPATSYVSGLNTHRSYV